MSNSFLRLPTLLNVNKNASEAERKIFIKESKTDATSDSLESVDVIRETKITLNLKFYVICHESNHQVAKLLLFSTL